MGMHSCPQEGTWECTAVLEKGHTHAQLSIPASSSTGGAEPSCTLLQWADNFHMAFLSANMGVVAGLVGTEEELG